jgi:hypothetical protein
MSQIFEVIMVVSFGISWPSSILKSYTARTAKGKSIIFLFFVLVGYAFGIASKFIAGKITYVVIFYIINFIMVSIDLLLYLRNRRLDTAREREACV